MVDLPVYPTHLALCWFFYRPLSIHPSFHGPLCSSIITLDKASINCTWLLGLSLSTIIQSLMWSLFIIVHHRHFPCPCALHCTWSNGWPCPWCTPRPSGSSSTVCLEVPSNGSAVCTVVFWFDLIRLKRLEGERGMGLPCPVLRARSSAI